MEKKEDKKLKRGKKKSNNKNKKKTFNFLILILIIILIIILGTTMLFYKPQLQTLVRNSINPNYLNTQSQGFVPLFQTSYTGNYIVLSQSGNESLYDVNITKDSKTGLTTICLEAGWDEKEVEVYKIEIDSKTGEEKEVLDYRYNYSVPSTLSFYKTEELSKESDLIKTKTSLSATSITNPNKFCYTADPNKDFYLKFGDNSVVVIQENIVSTNSILNNVTSEGNFTHLTINNASTNAPYDSLVGYWNFDGDKEDTLLTTHYDWTNYNRDGTGVGNLKVNNSNCIYGDCAIFDPAGDYIKILGVQFNYSNITACAWVKVNITDTNRPAIITSGINSVMNWSIVMRNGLIIVPKGITISGVRSAHTISDNSWHHVCGQPDPQNVYIDGALDNGDTYSSTYTLYANATIGYGNAVWVNGFMDEIMVFNTSLTAQQILAIYNNQSSRFAVSGTQDIVNQTYMNISTGNNRVNVKTYIENNFGSSINLSVGYYDTSWGYTTPQVVSSGVVQTFTISDTSTNLTLNYTFYAGNDTNPFYSPIIQYNISFEVWNEAGGDTTYPIFSDYYDDNATLLDTGTGHFNVTVINTNGTVILHINHTEIYATNLSADNYNVSFEFTHGGNYMYNWTAYGNGTSNNQNISNNFWYTVNTTPPIDTSYPLFSTPLESPAEPVEYAPNKDYIFNITIANTNGTAGIDFNNVNYSMINDSNVFGAIISNLATGNYTYYYWAFGNGTDNLFNKSITYSYNVSINNSYVLSLEELPSTSWTETYGTETTITGSGCPAELICNLSRNDTGGIDNPNIQTLSGGSYNYTFNTSGNTNYSSKLVSEILTINKENGLIRAYINNTEDSFNSTNGIGIWLNATLITGSGEIYLVLNGTEINRGASPLSNLTDLPYGYYNLTAYYDGNDNYTSDYEYWWINITQILDTTPPYFSVRPDNPTIYENTSVGYQFNGTDETAFANYSINDTINFVINSTGYLENITGLSVGTYDINITINDTSGNTNSTIFIITVNSMPDTTPPYFSVRPDNPTIYENTSVGYQFNGTDETAFGYYSINWTTTFTINSTGYLSNISSISAGTYDINITINDTSENTNSTIFIIIVNAMPIPPDITPPTFDNLRNFTHYVNTSFSNSITATDDVAISSYWLNDTNYFNINGAGLITNVTNLSRIEMHTLNISVNDTSGNIASGIFWINITEVPITPTPTISATPVCRYKKFGYFNPKLPFFREVNCI